MKFLKLKLARTLKICISYCIPSMKGLIFNSSVTAGRGMTEYQTHAKREKERKHVFSQIHEISLNI